MLSIIICTSYPQLKIPPKTCMSNQGKSWLGGILLLYSTFVLRYILKRLHTFLLPTSMFVDHINHNKLDNRMSNLRECTSQQNFRNAGGVKKTSIFKGVSFTNKCGRWAVYAKFPGSGNKRFWGYYDTEIEAAKAYNKYAQKYGDEFSYLNIFPNS